jgi:rhodanese-related sulfurtransferase
MQLERSASDLLTDTRDRIREIGPAEARERHRDEETVFLDVRETAEVQDNDVIPGAAHVPRAMVEFKADPTTEYHDSAFDPANQYVCYCVVGLRSAFVTDRLQQMGYDIVNLDGGITAWKDADCPVRPFEDD